MTIRNKKESSIFYSKTKGADNNPEQQGGVPSLDPYFEIVVCD